MRIPDIYLPYGPYGFDREVLKKKLLLELSCCNAVETDKVLAAWRSLPWDSKHFGCEMLELKYFLAEEDTSFGDRCVAMGELHEDWLGCDHVTARINAFDILSSHVAESFGFSLMDTNVKYGIDLRKASLPDFHGSKLAKEGVVYEVIRCPCHFPELIPIAEASWSRTRVAIDRFHADRNFPRNLADRVYVEWLRNSLTGELADYVIVARVEDEAVGFLTVKQHADSVEDTEIGLLVLAAVDPSTRGKHIYTDMISLALRFLKRRAGIVETGSQITNYPVQKAWVELGLKLVSTTYVFHKWLAK